MKVLHIFLIVLMFYVQNLSAEAFETRSYTSEIRTLRAIVGGNALGDGIMVMGEDEVLSVSFDLMGYEQRSLEYKIVHCNADWTESGLSSMEYIDGFDNGTIDDYEYSINTTVNYIHYRIDFPNEDTKFTKSGNYAVLINDAYNNERPLAVVCFSITEDVVLIDGKSSSNTMYEISGKYQQLEMAFDYSSLPSTSPSTEFKVVLEQNGRRDNMKVLQQPTYTQVNSLIYRDNRSLIFEGGNTYRSFDISSEYTYGAGVERIEAVDNKLNVVMEPSVIRSDKGYDNTPSVYGKFAVNRQGTDYDDVEADYMWVHFFLPMKDPMLTGSVYIIGDMVQHSVGGRVLMHYDNELRGYFASMYLKQGGYNYMYVFQAKGADVLSL